MNSPSKINNAITIILLLTIALIAVLKANDLTVSKVYHATYLTACVDYHFDCDYTDMVKSYLYLKEEK